MTNDESKQVEWQDCQSGLIGGMLRSNAQRRHRRFLLRIGGLTTTAFLVALLVFTNPNTFRDDHKIGGIWCSEIHNCGDDYHANKLSPAVMKKIERHIAICLSCRDFLAKDAENESSAIPACDKPAMVAASLLLPNDQDLVATLSIP